MLSAIRITDDFKEINKEYKRFKHILAIKWCTDNELSIKKEEDQLIKSINLVIDKLKNNQMRKAKDNNIMHVLIATKALSKYTILNHSQCIEFFTEIAKNLPNSIHKRLFFFKCAVKNYKDKSNHLWDNFNRDLHNRILPKNQGAVIVLPSIEDALIYIGFLIQYAPDYICLISNEIFLHLFHIIQNEEYILDLNYDILKYTNNTIATYFTRIPGQHKYYSNYAIELLRSILDKVNLIRYQTIEIQSILTWEPIKALATLSVLFEKCQDSFFNAEIDRIHQFLIDADRSNADIQCLVIRNLIFCSFIKEGVDNEIISDVLAYSNQEKPNIISGQLQNIKLLIDKKHSFLEDNSFYAPNVVSLILDNINSNNETIKNNAYDLLNSCILLNQSIDTIFEFDSSFIEKLSELDLNLNNTQVVNFVIDNNADKQIFLHNLENTLHNKPLETLQFLNDNIRSVAQTENQNQNQNQNNDEESGRNNFFNSFIKGLQNDEIDQICQAVYTYRRDQDENIRQLVPLVIVKMMPNLVFGGGNLDEFLSILENDTSEKVKVSILRCFNDYLNTENFNNYPQIREKFNPQNESTLFDILFNDKSPDEVQIETIKFVCKLSQFNINYNNIIDNFMNFFKSFEDQKRVIKIDQKTEVCIDINNYIILPKKLALQSEFLPYIFESFPRCSHIYFQSFYNFALDFMTAGICPNLKFKRRLNFELKVIQMTYFQRKFFKSIFLSFIKSLKIIHRKKPTSFPGNCSDTINFCITVLQEGMGRKETEFTLSFLYQMITKIGINALYKLYKSDRISQLYTVVLETGSRFNSPETHQIAFRILGFLGAQPPCIKEQPIYEFDDKKHRFNDKLQKSLMSKNIEDDRINEIFFTACFNSVRSILDNELMCHIHYIALESLINILSLCKEATIGDSLDVTLNYFKKMMENNANQDKREFVRLFGLLMSVTKSPLKAKASELSHIFRDLWDYGSLSIIDRFTAVIGHDLCPCLQAFFPDILTIEDKELEMKTLCLIHKNCYFNTEYNYARYNIPDILIQLGNEGYFNAFHYLNDILFKIFDPNSYVQPIVMLFLNYINKLNSNKDLKIYLKEAVELIIGLSCVESTTAKNSILVFQSKIVESLKRYPDEIQRLLDNWGAKKVGIVFRNKSFESIQPDIKINQSQLDKFRELIISTNSFIEDEVNPLYIEQWLEKLILFCIQNSSKKFIRFTYPVAKNNQVLANSIFNIAFYSLYSLYSEFKAPPEISKTFINVLSSKIASQHCKAMIIDLIEFMDRLFKPLFTLKSIKIPLNSIFSSKPPMALRYAIQNYQQKNKFSESNLQLAYLNVGLFDNYKQFSLSLNNANITETLKIIYKLPIFERTVEEIHKIDTANSFFEKESWNNFNTQIENMNLRTVTHLFRTASLINRKWSGLDIDNQQILDEINRGFEALGHEGGPHFKQGFSSVTQSIVYGQQFVELQEMLSSDSSNKFNIRSQNSSQIASFLPPILMLRKTANGKIKNSLTEELSLLSLFRKSNRWESILDYYYLFNEDNNKVEFQYEMMYYYIANNLVSVNIFDDLIEKVNASIKNEANPLGEEYNKLKIIENIKFQKAVYLAHSPQRDNQWNDIISICNDIKNNSDAVNLLGWSNFKLFELTNDGEYLNQSIKNYIESLANEKVRTSNLSQIIYLLFKYYNHNETNSKTKIENIEKEIKKNIQFHYYFDVMSQIISYIPSLKENSFKHFIMKLLTQIVTYCPESVIHDYSFSIFSDKTMVDGSVISSPIEDIMKKTNLPHFNQSINLTRSLIKINSNFFCMTTKFLNKIKNLIFEYLINDSHEKLLSKVQMIYKICTSYINQIYVHVMNYLKGIPESYELCSFELGALNEKNKENFEKLKTFLDLTLTDKINQVVNAYKEYNKAVENNDPKTVISRAENAISSCKRNLKNALDSQIRKFDLHPPDDLYQLSSKINEMKDLKLPVFGTFHFNSEKILIKEFDHHLSSKKSLKAPKVLKIRGTDGNLYPFILKESEDLRTDQRVMIFQRFLNRFLKINIKTYSIVPLTPQLGMIQHVNGKTTIGHLIKRYQQRFEFIYDFDSDSITGYECQYVDFNNFEKLTRLQKCERYVDILNLTKDRANDLRESFWYLTPSSESWLKFTKNFSNSCAITSIVGYIIGIGDRHLKNIMIDTREGYLMHIDFCDVFEVNQIRKSNPEMVPFRLTRNLVSALGLCGYNGSFRLQCEETLSMIRENREAIVNILSVFVDSPIFQHKSFDYSFIRNPAEIKRTKESAEKALKRIVKKVNGTDNAIILPLDFNLDNEIGEVGEEEPLSVSNHVQKLIECAINPYNLCGSYIGWMPWR